MAIGDAGKNNNSGSAVCGARQRGTAGRGVRTAVALADKYPGIDGATMGWVHLGGRLEERNGQYHIVDADGFARFLDEALRANKLVEATRSVVRTVKSKGYRVAAGGAFPDPNLPKSIEPSVKQAEPAELHEPVNAGDEIAKFKEWLDKDNMGAG